MNPSEISVQEAAAQLQQPDPPRLIDVREAAEWDIVHLEGARLISQQLIDEILEDWPRDTSIICYCHHGIRSLNAASFLARQGFSRVASMRGGIDAWSREIDPSLPRY